MSNPFLSSEEYDERAHSLYDAGQVDEALELLREGLSLYPASADLHVGAGYARLAREEYAWALKRFEEALHLDPDHEDALAGFGEVMLKLGRDDEALNIFNRIVVLGHEDDAELMLQIGRALFRENLVEEAARFFTRAANHSEEPAEAIACLGYAQHRMGREQEAVVSLRKALTLDGDLSEARIYLANILFDDGHLEEALSEFEQTEPDDHWDELGITRIIELERTLRHKDKFDADLLRWVIRLDSLAEETDDLDELLADITQKFWEKESAELAAASRHRVVMRDGSVFEGTWDDIVQALRDTHDAGRPVEEYMAMQARRYYGATGKKVASDAAEAFIRGSADAGILRIER